MADVPFLDRDGVRLSYRVTGEGPLVVLVMGTGSPGRVWHLHQVPALVAAGYRVATPDNRGIAPSDECADGFTLDDMVGDVAALIELLGGGPAAVVGTSLGARITQELAVARPDLVDRIVLLAAHGRPDPVQRLLSEGERALWDAGIDLPEQYRAATTALFNLSPATLADPVVARDWLDLFAISGGRESPGVRVQMGLSDSDRLDVYRAITARCLVVGFADDRMLPPLLAREVADVVPGARYVELERCGHFGYLERPDAVNELILGFLGETSTVGGGFTPTELCAPKD